METKSQTTRPTTKEEKAVLNYLNDLRDSGVTNMFGATSYIIKKFGHDKGTARGYLSLWMENFNAEGNYDNVKIYPSQGVENKREKFIDQTISQNVS